MDQRVNTRGKIIRKMPLIGVTGPDTGHGFSWSFIGFNIRLARARLVRLTPGAPQSHLEIDGLIVSGGCDIDPTIYGGERKKDYPYDHARDALEMAWVQQAMKSGMPLLGICRGMQMMNVCAGGTLYTDIKLVCESAEYPDTVLSKIFARKPVAVKNPSLIHELMKREAVMVNSLHRQSLDKIGEGLALTAWEHNGIVQAVEGEGAGRFLLGVQWHPEFMINSRRQRGIFRKLVREARRYRLASFKAS